ncbi:dihydrodipicolinate synthase family protein [Caproiciproducens faecalis]|uniref:Dihydrodipicolinate synthase family protein n=1 Tax=Caproiciproducens faecalis TaxID=2820301 RepID=A0ABS7DJY3_9FIRM|nr:dihydrodipicolinate synthase family protein [Caproiciproducens faecalis]MBW7571416.1 dihydrodipicolinate synthase family protein [Caproiciproducens faecalis]
MNTDFMRGIVVPLLTPIDKDERIDETKLRKMVDHVIKGGVLGILAFGSNGEFYMVDEDESERGLKIILDQTKGRVPVYYGIGAIKTRKCIQLAQMAERAGASAVSILQPMFLKPTDDELYEHFKAIAQSVPNTPVLLYNNPGRTGYTLSANLVNRLSHEVENIVGIKDSSGDMTQTSNFVRITRDVNFKVFGGKDTLIFSALAIGAAGCIATTANVFPELVTSIYARFSKKDYEGALEAQYKLDPVRLLMDKASFPVATKDYANLTGLDVGEPYRPNLATKGALLETMQKELTAADLL